MLLRTGLLIATLLCHAFRVAAGALSDADIDQRIDRVRKADFVVRFTAADGNPLANSSVSYRLVQHQFPLGTCLSTEVFRLPENHPDRIKYLDTVAKYFNHAVHENALKWYAMELERGRFDDETPMAMWRWCRDHNITMRGHCIFWGVPRYVQPWLKKLPSYELEKAMKSRAKHVLKLFDGKITEFDLNNEMMHRDYYASVLPLEDGAQYFTWCKEIAPNATFYVNEHSILSGAETQRYVQHIRGLIQAGAGVGGIGCQGHFVKGMPDNDELWRKLDTLSQFNLPIKVTEFDFSTTDEEEHARGLRRFYRLCFAHPSVAGILMWGFWERSHWRPEAALWRNDWSVKPAGEAYVKLVTEEWITRGEGVTNDRGELHFRGFCGTYRLESNGRSYLVTLTRESPKVIAG
jgi:GH35 family endo-1,4-beta-xylanase